jgi:tetratricopeptide (TPR) repeat protein
VTPVPTKTVRYQPYRDADGNYAPLVDFVRRHAPVLQPGFDAPAAQSDNWNKSEPYVSEESGWQYGSEVGIKVSFREEYEQRAMGIAVSGVTVATFGLNHDRYVAITCERNWYDPRYIELSVQGPGKAIEQIAEAFAREFGSEQTPTPEQLRKDLVSAEVSVRARAWDAAEMQAREILKHQPDNAQALFYLGVALAAIGKHDEAAQYLARAVEADPANYDAWYNLGNVSFEEGRYEEAITQLRRSLEISPDNHPVLYRLGLALEKTGKIEEAIEAYEIALRTAPNPGQVLGYRGLDFEPQAKEALQRLRR